MSKTETQTQATFNHIEDETRGEWYNTEYRIVRTPDTAYTSTQDLNYEFVLVVDGDVVTTAAEMERRGHTHPWIPVLREYAKAYIDGASGHRR